GSVLGSRRLAADDAQRNGAGFLVGQAEQGIRAALSAPHFMMPRLTVPLSWNGIFFAMLMSVSTLPSTTYCTCWRPLSRDISRATPLTKFVLTTMSNSVSPFAGTT